MKKLLYLLLVVPFLFLLISCDEGKSKEQREFEKSLNIFEHLDKDYLAEHGVRIEMETNTTSDSYSTTTTGVYEIYKNSYVIKTTSGLYSDSFYGYLTFKKNDIIIDSLSEDSEDAKEEGKIYRYGDVILYETNEKSISYKEGLDAVLNMAGYTLNVKDFEKLENGYTLKKPITYTLYGDYSVNLTKYIVELEDGRLSNAYYEATIDYDGFVTFSTYSMCVDYDATIDTYIQEAVKEVK